MDRMLIRHIIRQCPDPGCAFRFPVQEHSPEGLKCPFCGAETRIVAGPYPELVAPPAADRAGYRIEVLLDNIRSTYNVGSIFRSAEGCGVRHIYLCGMTPDPSHRKLQKTALGAEKTVNWSSHRNALVKAAELKAAGRTLWALEGGDSSVSLFGHAPSKRDCDPVLVVGNEISGIDPAILRLCDKIFHIPMQGGKTSLNAAIAFGIGAYHLSFGLPAAGL